MTSLLVVGASLLALAATEQSNAPEPRRVAILVGSNEAISGRQKLHYAHLDVERVADVLLSTGRFRPTDVRQLLEPAPSAVLKAIDEALASLKDQPGETLFLFYYSGHADSRALYPGGTALEIEALKQRLESPGSTVRVGIIDACRGGGWTQAKGLSPTPPFEVEIPLQLGAEGSVLMASSSGLENAHETKSLQGSFFTHHLVAGLRGAADRSGDGVVTASEAFEYAKALTVRDTAIETNAAQHPSYNFNLRGRSDLPLTTVAASSSTLAVSQTRGPLQLIHLSTGLKLLELVAGERTLTLAVPPGQYLLKRVDGDDRFVKQLEVHANESVSVAEDSLTLQGEARLATKGEPEIHAADRTTLPAHTIELGVGGGYSYNVVSPLLSNVSLGGIALDGRARWAFTDRLEWAIATLSASYRFGEHGVREWVVAGGMLEWGLGFFSDSPEALFPTLYYRVGASAAYREWLGGNQSLNVAAEVSTQGEFPGGLGSPNRNYAGGSIGYSHLFADILSVNVGVSFHQAFGAATALAPNHLFVNSTLSLGSVQWVGFKHLSLVELHLGPIWSVYGDVELSFNLAGRWNGQRFVVGSAWVF